MFEVGKKYKYVNDRSTRVYECIAVCDHYGWLTLMNDNAPVTCSWGQFIEYVEPRKEYFNSYKSKSGKNTFFEGPFNSLSSANNEAGSLRHGILTVTHHSDTKVETHFVVVPRGKT
jgi:hypothetical protein